MLFYFVILWTEPSPSYALLISLIYLAYNTWYACAGIIDVSIPVANKFMSALVDDISIFIKSWNCVYRCYIAQLLAVWMGYFYLPIYSPKFLKIRIHKHPLKKCLKVNMISLLLLIEPVKRKPHYKQLFLSLNNMQQRNNKIKNNFGIHWYFIF